MKNIEIVCIPVKDQQKSKEFYLKLGFQVIIEMPMGDGNTWVQLGIPNQVTSISLAPYYKNYEPGSFHGLILETEDIEKEITALKEKGVELTEMDDTPWGKFVHLKDPDGNGLSIHENPKN